MEGQRSELPRVSIILPCYNEEQEIRTAIREVQKQTFGGREIIVVDDGSTDETAPIAEEYCVGHPDTRVIRIAHSGLTHVRNVGIRESKGEIIFFAESDCVYDADYVEKAVQCLDAQPDANAVCLTGGPLKVRSTLATECIEIENVVQHKLLAQGKIKPFYAWVFRRAQLVAIGGFDERLFQGEDKDVFRRFVNAGNKVAWLPGIHWRHKRDQTTWQLAQKWFFRGRSRVLYAVKHGLMKDFAKTLLPFWLLVFGLLYLLVLPIVGVILIALVLALFVGNTIRIARIAWSSLSNRRYLLGYPFFLMVRNFSSALGYMWGLITPYTYSAGMRDANASSKLVEEFSEA